MNLNINSFFANIWNMTIAFKSIKIQNNLNQVSYFFKKRFNKTATLWQKSNESALNKTILKLKLKKKKK